MSISMISEQPTEDLTSTSPILHEIQGLHAYPTLPLERYQALDATIPTYYQVEIPEPQTLIPFLAFSDSEHEIIKETQDLLVARFQGQWIEEIKQTVGEIPLDVEKFLRMDIQTTYFLDQILSTMQDRLRVIGGLPCVFSLRKWQDVEVTEMKDIEVLVKLAIKDYDKLLKIWEMIDEDVYQNVPPEVSEKIVVIFEQL